MQSCLNCHNSDETPPPLLAQAAFLNERNASLEAGSMRDVENILFPPQPCSARDHWPEWLRQPHPRLQALPWWVRSNYENVRREMNGDAPPFRIHGVEGALHLQMVPRNFSYRIFGEGGSGSYDMRSLGFRVMPGGNLQSHLRIINDEVPWPVEGLLEFHNIGFDGPLFLNYRPLRLLPTSEGELCLYAAHNMTYSQPRGWSASTPPSDRWALEILGYEFYFTGGEAPRFCSSVPHEFHQPSFTDAPLPSSFELEDLIRRILRWRRRADSSSGASSGSPLQSIFLEGQNSPIQNIFDLTQPGSEMILNIDQLSDLFIPGVFDLGASQGRVRVFLDSHRNLGLEGDNLEMRLDPMDYPAVTGETRPPVHLLEGRIFMPLEPTLLNGESIEPGLHVRINPRSQIFAVRLNLNLDVTLHFPEVGNVSFQIQMAGETHGLFNEQGLKLFPGSTTLRLQNLQVRSDQGRLPSIVPLEFLLSDDVRSEAPMEAASVLGSGRSRFLIRFTGTLPSLQNQALLVESRMEVPVNDQGFYDFSRLLDSWGPIDTLAELVGAEHHQSLQLSLNHYAVPGGRRGYEARVEFGQDHHPLLQGGRFYFQPEAISEGHLNFLMGFEANRVEASVVSLIHPSFHLQGEFDQTGSGHYEVRLPRLRVRANPSGSSRGWLRGPLHIEQQDPREGSPLILTYNADTRQAAIRNLNLRFFSQRMTPPGIFGLSHHEISSLDLDGRLQGHWSQNFATERGRGNLCLVGDPQGDLTLRGRRGRRIPDPLVSETRWCAFSVNRIDEDRQILWGNFFLDTTIDLGLLRYFGIHINMRERGRMAHDNFPYSARGYESIERLFIRRVGEEHHRGAGERREEP